MASPNTVMIMSWASHLVLILLFVFPELELSTQSHSLVSATNHPHYKYSMNNWFPKEAKGSRKGQFVRGLHEVKHYLTAFGYLSATQSADAEANDAFDEQLERAINTYQMNHNLPVTGALDEQTVTLMMTPRCGVPDMVLDDTNLENSLYTFTTNNKTNATYTWPRKRRNLTYALVGQLRGQQVVNFATLGRVARDGFGKWRNAAPSAGFMFGQINNLGRANIKINFSSTTSMGRPYSKGNRTFAVAHPPQDGRMFINTAVNWATNGAKDRVDLETVVTHEIGHLLGLGHSSVKNAIMYPTLAVGQVKKNLSQDDINGIRALYR